MNKAFILVRVDWVNVFRDVHTKSGQFRQKTVQNESKSYGMKGKCQIESIY